MNELEILQKEIAEIKARNAKVEIDKAWEISMTRKVWLSVITYVVVLLFFLVAKLPNPFVNALVPTLGFFISTLTLKFVKTFWIKCKK